MASNDYGFCELPVIQLRKGPSHREELVSQLLYGEIYEVTGRSEDGDWIKVTTAHDNYEGWFPRGQHKAVSPAFVTYYSSKRHPLVSKGVAMGQSQGHSKMLTMGSILVQHPEIAPLEVAAEDQCTQIGVEQLQEHAFRMLDVPYLWGGRSAMGIDCSGFAQLLYRLMGYSLPRDAYQQADCGVDIRLQEGKLGDLAFFTNAKGRVIHVGMLLGPDRIIHSAGNVRIDKIDQKGIWRADLQEYTHSLSRVKRLLGEDLGR